VELARWLEERGFESLFVGEVQASAAVVW